MSSSSFCGGSQLTSSSERTVRFAAPDHLLTVGVEGIVDDPLGGDALVVVLDPEVTEPLGDGIESRRLGLVPQGVVGVGPVDDLRQKDQGGVAPEAVLLDDGVERTLFAVVPEFDIRNVEGD